jgi:hypothetical protein
VIIYYAGVDSNPKDVSDAFASGARHFMISFYYWRKHKTVLRLLRQLGAHIMLDSGAFSSWKGGESINLADYIAYIKRNQIGKYVVLDEVGDPEATDYNLSAMEREGLFPIPVFHIGTPYAKLDEYAANYRYIALGGTVGKSRSVRDSFFSEVFARHPELYYHGLGMTVPELMRKYPWMSVDSTTWQTGKKNARQVTDDGQVPLDSSLSVSERVAVNVRYFHRLEYEIKQERFGDAV